MNSLRNLFITGVAMFLGLSIPEYFREYTAGALHGPAHTKAGWVSWSFPQYISNDPLSHPTNLKRTINIVGRDVHGDFVMLNCFILVILKSS